MDKELQDLLDKARGAGANETQMQGIVDSYKQKKSPSDTSVVEQVKTPTKVPVTASSSSDQSFNSFPTVDAGLNKNTVTTKDGTSFDLVHPTPFNANDPSQINSLQDRVTKGIATPEDMQILSSGSGKSVAATSAYLNEGKDMGSAIEITDNITKSNLDISKGIDFVKSKTGSIFEPEKVLSSADQSSQLLLSLKQVELAKQQDIEKYNLEYLSGPQIDPYGNTVPLRAEPINDPIVNTQTKNTIDALTYNIKKLTIDEANKKGLTNEQAGELLYQRLDPEGYAKNQQMRDAPKADFLPLVSGVSAVNKLIDWVTGRNDLKKEVLNSEKGQYELEANDGLKSLAIEKKAQAIVSNDPTALEESETLAKKVQNDRDIVTKYPLMMKQEMAQYVNDRIAKDSGVLNGTDATTGGGFAMKMTGASSTVIKKYLTDGGYYDNPKYKDYADEIVSNPSTYLADNSMFGGVGVAFLKPFKSIFNTVADLEGVRNQSDRHTDVAIDEKFPSRLTDNVKEDISFNLPDFMGGSHIGMNVSNTINSVANLGGYVAATAATAGIGTEAGLAAKTAERVAAWSSFGMDAVDTGLKEADKMGLSPAESWMYAGMKGVMMAEGGRLLEFGKAGVPEIAGVNEAVANAVKGITDKSLAESSAKEAIDGAVNIWGEGLKKYGVGTVKGAAVMSSFGIGDTMLKVAFGDKNASTDNILPEAANSFFNGLFTMGIIGGMGIKGNIEDAKNSTYKGMLKKVIDNHDASSDILKIGLDKGLFSPEEYDQKVGILNTGIKAKATLQDIETKTGVKLTPEQRASWIANATIEKSLRNEAESPNTTEVKSKEYLDQANNLSEQNSNTLDGLTFNKHLEPNIDLYNATKELRQAQDDFTKQQTPQNEKVLIEKKNAVDEINYSDKSAQIEAERQKALSAYRLDNTDMLTNSIPSSEGDGVSKVVGEVGNSVGGDKSASGYGTIAADYLLTGGFDVMQSSDYLIQAFSGLFERSGGIVESIRNKYAKEIADSKLTDIKDFVKSDLYNKIMAEIKNAVNKEYNNNPLVEEIFNDVLKYPTGMPQRVGNEISSKIDKLESLLKEQPTEPIQSKIVETKQPEVNKEQNKNTKADSINSFFDKQKNDLISDYSHLNINSDGKSEKTQQAEDAKRQVLNENPASTGAGSFPEIKDTEILPTLDKVKAALPEADMTSAQDVLTKVNSAENINEADIKKAEDNLYSALDAAPESAHLIEPLITKLQNYDFTTKTETGTVTKEVATEIARPPVERAAVSKNLDQWEGSRATITDESGKEVTGVLKSDENGKYHLYNGNGDKVASIGEKAITDKHISLPSSDVVSSPIEVDGNGDVKAITLQINKVDMENGGVKPSKLIKINFRDPEKALDYAIALRAEQVGDFPQPEFDVLYKQVEQEVSKEVLVKKEANKTTDTPIQADNSSVAPADTAPIADLSKPNEPVVNNGGNDGGNSVDAGNPPADKTGSAPLGKSPEGVGITHAQTNEIANWLGFDEYEKKPGTFEEWDAEADKRIAADKNTIPNLLDKMRSGHIPDKIEQRIMGKYIATLKAEIENTGSNEAISKMRDAVDLSNIQGGRDAAQTLVARKGIYDMNDSLAGYMMTEMDSNLSAPLTDNQKATVKKEHADIQVKKENADKTKSDLDAKNNEKKAQDELNKVKKSSKSHDDFVKDRASIIEAAKEKIKKAREKANSPDAPKISGIGRRTYADDLFTIAPEVLKLVKSYAEEGITKLSEVVKKVHPEFTDSVPGITEKDIHDIIAGDYNKKQKTKTQLAADVYNLKLEAKLINKLQRLQEGTEPTIERKKIEHNQEIESLQKQIKDFRRDNPDQKAYLKSIKSKNESALKKVQDQINSGDFTIGEKKTSFLYDSELQKQFPKEFADAVKAQRELMKAKQDREVRLMVQQYEKRSQSDKVKDEAIRYLNVPRTLMASMDFSAPMRQAVVVTVAHPLMAAKAAGEMFRSAFSQKRFDEFSYGLKDSPSHQLMMDSGLSLTDPHNLHLQAQEEAFMGNIAEGIPYVGQLIKGSERAYVSYLNKMRVDLFNRFSDVYADQGRTFENSPELYKGLASYVNNATGRGKLGFAEAAAPVLTTMLFSPRLIASRFNMLGLGDIASLGNGFYGKLPKEVRVQALGDMAKFIGAGVSFLALAKFGFGAQVEADPRSSDFGKLKSGDTRWDLWGGFQPFVRVLAQTITAERKSANTGKIINLTGKGSKFGTSPVDPLVSFSRGKLAPIPSMIWDVLSRRTVQGEKVLMKFTGDTKPNEIDLTDEAVQHFFPLIFSDVGQAMQSNGISSLFTVGIPSTFGVGVQTYSNKKR